VSSKKQVIITNVRLGRLVHGGQALGETAEGKKIFIWGGLPGELVDVRVTKKKSSYLEGIVTEVHEPGPDRIEPLEPLSYLSTSPWQIVNFAAENKAKQSILQETFQREGLESVEWGDFVGGDQEYGYRNKVEFGFWGDDDGLHLAHYVRGTHGKQIITANALADDRINQVAAVFINNLDEYAKETGLRAGDLKTVVFRSSQGSEVVAALFVKKQPEFDFTDFKVPEGLKGLDIYYSNPKSPASVPTEKIYSSGDITLTDSIMDTNITYDVLSFFQVNVPVFERALQKVLQGINGKSVIDFYSGVGTIGIPIGASVLVESDATNVAMAKHNIGDRNIKVIEASSQSAGEYINDRDALIVDPPRAGLHKDVIARILEAKPPKVVYLSCNPSTQARDVALLTEVYKIQAAQGYNFFPRTPHIESLIVLQLK